MIASVISMTSTKSEQLIPLWFITYILNLKNYNLEL